MELLLSNFGKAKYITHHKTRDIWNENLKHADSINIATGYISSGSLIELAKIVELNPKPNANPSQSRILVRNSPGLSKETDAWVRSSLWRENESRLGRVDNGVAHWMDRIKAIGNGQVPACMAEAFLQLLKRFSEG